MELFNMQIMINIKVIGKIVKDMETDYMNMLMEILITVNGRMI